MTGIKLMKVEELGMAFTVPLALPGGSYELEGIPSVRYYPLDKDNDLTIQRSERYPGIFSIRFRRIVQKTRDGMISLKVKFIGEHAIRVEFHIGRKEVPHEAYSRQLTHKFTLSSEGESRHFEPERLYQDVIIMLSELEGIEFDTPENEN